MINEGVKFVLTLKDHMSGAMPKVGRAAQSAFAKVNVGAKKAKRDIDVTGRSVKTLERALRMMERRRDISIDSSDIDDANRKISTLQKRLKQLKTPAGGAGLMAGGTAGATGGRMGGRLGGMLSYGRMAALGLALGGTAMVAGGVRSSASAGLQGGANLVSFQTMAGEQQGAKLYRDLTKFAQDSIFGNELYKLGQTQMAFGADAKTVMPTLKMLGDVSMGDKNRLQSLNLAYSQSRSAGKLMGQDLLQFINAGFNPLQVMQAQSGKSMSQLREEMSKGLITFKQVEGAFKAATSEGGKFYKMTERIADTPLGKVENLRGQIDGVMLRAGEAMAPAIGKAIDKYASPFVDFVGERIVPTMNSIMEFGSEIAIPLRNLAETSGMLLQPVSDLVSSDEMKSTTREIVKLADNIGKDLTPVMRDLVTILKPVLGTVAGAMHWVNKGGEVRRMKFGGGMVSLRNAENRRTTSELESFNNRLNRKFNPSTGTANLNSVWQQFKDNQVDAPSVFGAQFKSDGKTMQPSSVSDANNTASTTADATGMGTQSTSDVITGGGKKVLNININSSPFRIEQMHVDATGTAIQGGDVRQLERMFSEAFGRWLNSLGY